MTQTIANNTNHSKMSHNAPRDIQQLIYYIRALFNALQNNETKPRYYQLEKMTIHDALPLKAA